MSKARQLADLLDSNGDVVVGALDNAPDPDLTPYVQSTALFDEGGDVLADLLGNVPPSNDASALTTGTLAKTLLPEDQIQQVVLANQNYGAVTFPQDASYLPFLSASITPTSESSRILIFGLMEVELNGGNYPALNLSVRRGTGYAINSVILRGYEGAENNHSVFVNPIVLLDSPATTNTVTYYYYGANASGSTFTGGGGRGNAYNSSSILLIEIKG